MITAPFNFVPLSEKVFFPDWAEKVSHDIPFEDAQSGVIDITITAKSPIFVRDGKDDNKENFCEHNGTYYIPGSSVKGMTRNILEIMSFSKMSQVNDDTYAVRDLRNRELYMSKMTPENTFCGFLKKTEDGYAIEDCGKPGRIKHAEIGKIFNMDFASKFRDGEFSNKAKDKTAKAKYDMIKSNEFEHGFEYVKKDVNRKIYRYEENADKKGILVLTGQPSARKEPPGQKPSGKVYEFVFFKSRGDIRISKETYENFLFAYFNGRETEPKESPDWTFWKKKLNSGQKVPIFFQKNGEDVAHFGLSYLYKLPYSHSVKDGIPPAHNDTRKDLAETVFGYVGKDEALKGRVQFSHFKSKDKPQSQEVVTILGSPRPSYYPSYIAQNCTNGRIEGQYNTLMNDNVRISGWKRYPSHHGKPKPVRSTKENKSSTTFFPLGSYKQDGKFNEFTFNGKMRYHNLKKEELGALLSALTFHANQDDFYHGLGMAKPYGYGKVKVDIARMDEDKYIDALKSYEIIMKKVIGKNWLESEQIKELFVMANCTKDIDDKLEYLILNPERNKDEFKDAKNDRQCLKKASEIINTSIDTNKLHLTSNRVDEIKKRYAEIKAKEEYENIARERDDLLRNNVPSNRALNDAIQNYVECNMDKTSEGVYYDLKQFGVYLTGDANSLAGDIVGAYEALYNNSFFKEKLENLLVLKYNQQLTDIDKSRLYSLLVGEEQDDDSNLNEFITKWSLEKNNKGSLIILELVAKAQKELN